MELIVFNVLSHFIQFNLVIYGGLFIYTYVHVSLELCLISTFFFAFAVFIVSVSLPYYKTDDELF